MANFEIAFEWLLDNEDLTRSYKPVPDPGGFAISGINSASFPEDYAAIVIAPIAARRALIYNFYLKHFWMAAGFQGLVSDHVAKRAFDDAVNMGISPAVKLLQTAINACRKVFLQVDGQLGPHTLLEANLCAPGTLVETFREARVAHYKAIVAVHPNDQKYLAGWIARANK